MAILHNKEHKIATVIEKLPKKYSEDQFVEKFIQLFSKEWGKIKSAYIKQSQDKELGTVIKMPKPELYLKQLLKNFLQREDVKINEIEETESSTVATKNVEEPKETIKKVKLEKPESNAPSKKPKTPKETCNNFY